MVLVLVPPPSPCKSSPIAVRWSYTLFETHVFTGKADASMFSLATASRELCILTFATNHPASPCFPSVDSPVSRVPPLFLFFSFSIALSNSSLFFRR